MRISMILAGALLLSLTAEPEAQARKLKILHYSHTPSGESAHLAAKEAGQKALDDAAVEKNWEVYHTKDPGYFTDANLAPYDVLFFDNVCCYSGIMPQASQRAAVEKFLSSGKGYVANHGVAAATHYFPTWEYLARVNGNGKYGSHADPIVATLRVDDLNHYINQGLGSQIDVDANEWFRLPPFPEGSKIKLLVSIPKGSRGMGTSLSSEYLPVSWCHYYQGARAFYTSLGHFPAAFTNPQQRGHIFRALEWAGGRAPQTGACGEPVNGTGLDGESPTGGAKSVFAERYFSFRAAPLEIRGATLEPGSFRIELFDSRGGKVAQEAIQGAKSFSLKVRKPGIYMVRAFAGTAWFARRIIIL